MKDTVYNWICEKEPVNEERIKQKFGQEGRKVLYELIKNNRVFEARNGEFWSVGKP